MIDYSKIRQILVKEFEEDLPTPQESAAFLKGLVRMEECLAMDVERLNDSVPDAVALHRLQQQFDQLCHEVEELRDRNMKLEKRLGTMLQMDKKGRRKLRENELLVNQEQHIRQLMKTNEELIGKLVHNT